MNEESMRLTKQQQHDVLAVMLAEAKLRTKQGLPMKEITEYIRQARDDAKSAIRAGLSIMPAPEPEHREEANQ